MNRLFCIVLLILLAPNNLAAAEVVVPEVVKFAEQQRIQTIQRASRAAVAVFSEDSDGGGSGVVISPDGYALSNYHVTSSCGAAMKCGMSDGKVYDAVIVGIDPVGDVALIQLLGRNDFPAAELGDSDLVEVGDWAFTVGNPFLLADDFTPSVSYGMISGVRRYQYPAGTLLEYADCIQTDAAINPGNSGGPLFDANGKLIGINGRGSFEKRGRVNVGVGYAISINQIARFLSHLKSGRIVDHATLGATVATEEDGRVVVNDILESSDAFRRGLRYGDEVVYFANRDITNANRLKNALAVYPAGWTVPITFLREGISKDVDVRLMSLHDPSQLFAMVQQQHQQPTRRPDGEPREEPGEDEQELPNPLQRLKDLRKPKLPEVIAKRFQERRGYANYWYNLQQQEKLWKDYQETTGLPSRPKEWRITGETTSQSKFQLTMLPESARLRTSIGQFEAKFTEDIERQLSPPQSGGFLLTLHLWQRLLDKGLRQYGEVYYLGQLPSGPAGELVDCLVGIYAGTVSHFQFSRETGDLLGITMFPNEYSDPCQVYFSDFQEIAGERVPTQWSLHYGDHDPIVYSIESWEFGNE